MKLKTSTVIWTFIWCLFMGITVGSIGIGAAYPPANLIARPFVCPNGEMQVETKGYNPSPVEKVTVLTWYCVDSKTGAKTELGIFPMGLYAGAIYGLILFGLVIIGTLIDAKRKSGVKADVINESADRHTFADLDQPLLDAVSFDALTRMKELKKLRDANMISTSEYEKKRAEILKEL